MRSADYHSQRSPARHFSVKKVNFYTNGREKGVIVCEDSGREVLPCLYGDHIQVFVLCIIKG